MNSKDQQQDAATEAAQHVVDGVASWDYSADREVIEDHLDEGLAEAGVTLDEDERERLVEAIDAIKGDETAGHPEVDSARPEEA